FQGVKDHFCLDPLTNATVGSNPGRQMGKPASVAGQGGKGAFDEDAFGDQLPAKFGTWVFQQRFAAHAAGCLSAVAMAVAGTVTSRSDQLKVSTTPADVVKLIGIVVGVGQHVAL